MNAMSVGRRGGALYGWDAVTELETRVIDLVAEGLTNREIGRQLCISRHTVGSHLRHVFMKLEVTSRVGLTRAYIDRLVDQGRAGSPALAEHTS